MKNNTKQRQIGPLIVVTLLAGVSPVPALAQNTDGALQNHWLGAWGPDSRVSPSGPNTGATSPGAWDSGAQVQPGSSENPNAQKAKALLDQCGVAFKARRYAEGFQLCRQSLQLGNVDAREGLAVLYEVAQHDYRQAAYFYSLNADIHPVAANSLAWMYWRGGPNLDIDCVKARFYFEKAAKGGWRDAVSALGFMDELGAGGPRDRTRALEHFKAAAQRGDHWSNDIFNALQDPKAPRFESAEELGYYVADVRFRTWLQSQPLEPPPPGGGYSLLGHLRYCQFAIARARSGGPMPPLSVCSQ